MNRIAAMQSFSPLAAMRGRTGLLNRAAVAREDLKPSMFGTLPRTVRLRQ